MTLLVTVNGVDVSAFTESITRDVSMCEVSCGLVLQLDPRATTPDPYNVVIVDVDGLRRFTGYVSSTARRRSGGKWVLQVTCDHTALKRLKDYFMHETFDTGDLDLPIGAAIGWINALAGVTINWVSGLADALMPRNYSWTDIQLMSFLMDLALFGEAQISPQDDGTLLLTKAVASGTVYTDLTNIMTARERRLDDSMFRNMVMIFGKVAAYRTFGYNPYGYLRAAVVSNFMIQTNEKAKEIGDKMMTEFNRLLDVEKTTIAGRWNVPIASTAKVRDAKDGYTNYGIVTRLNDTFDARSGYQEVVTTNERCPNIFGFEYYTPYHDETTVIMHNHRHVLRCSNFLDLTVPAVWEEISINGQFTNSDIICSLDIDPDCKGAWLVTSGTTGEIETVSVSTAGTGYEIGDILSLSAPVGGTSATVTVTAINPATHGVIGVTITTGGTHYIPGYFGTTGGTGSGCVIRVLSVSFTDSGVYRTDDIVAGSFSLVLSQGAAKILGQAKKGLLGIKRALTDWGKLRSCVSFGNGSVCVPEAADPGSNDRAPTCVFTSTNSGASWTVSVPFYNGSSYPSNFAFWACEYFVTPCHQVDYNGADIVIAGRIKNALRVGGGYAISPDGGVNWTVNDVTGPPTEPTQLSYYSSNLTPGGTYCAYLQTSSTPSYAYISILIPFTGVWSPELYYDFGFRKTIRDEELVEIRYMEESPDPPASTGLYQNGVLVMLGNNLEVSVEFGGTGYSLWDMLTLDAPPGGTSATLQVWGITGGTTVFSVGVITPGTGYVPGVYATTNTGTGCTIRVLYHTSSPFGIARILADGEFIVAAMNVVKNTSADKKIVTYIAGDAQHDRSGNLLSILPSVTGWEGTEIAEYPNNTIDASGLEIITYSVAGYGE